MDTESECPLHLSGERVFHRQDGVRTLPTNGKSQQSKGMSTLAQNTRIHTYISNAIYTVYPYIFVTVMSREKEAEELSSIYPCLRVLSDATVVRTTTVLTVVPKYTQIRNEKHKSISSFFLVDKACVTVIGYPFKKKGGERLTLVIVSGLSQRYESVSTLFPFLSISLVRQTQGSKPRNFHNLGPNGALDSSPLRTNV